MRSRPASARDNLTHLQRNPADELACRGAANLLTGTERLDASGFARLWTRGAGPDERGGPSEGRTTLSNVMLSQPN
jgi:hypothetical protein